MKSKQSTGIRSPTRYKGETRGNNKILNKTRAFTKIGIKSRQKTKPIGDDDC